MDYQTDDLSDMSKSIKYNRWIISLFSNYLESNILEVGGGFGSFTKSLREFTSLPIHVIEPSSTPYNVLKDRIINEFNNTTCEQSYLFDLDNEKKFHSIIYNNVLEHIEDDVEELKIAYKHCKKNGHVIVYSPAFKLLMSNFDRKVGHFHRYSKDEIINKFKKANFEIVKCIYVDLIGYFLWYIKMVLLKSEKLGGRNVEFFDNVIVPINRIVEKTPPPFGKNILCVGKKIG